MNKFTAEVLTVTFTFMFVMFFWFGMVFALQTPHPLMAIASGSMEPVFRRGDIIVVHGVQNGSSINEGDVIVFTNVIEYAADKIEVITHRVVKKFSVNNTYHFKTKGDANPSADKWWDAKTGLPFPEGAIPENYVIGKVVHKIPWIGYIPLFLHSREGPLFIILIIVAFICVDLLHHSKTEKPKNSHVNEKAGVSFA